MEKIQSLQGLKEKAEEINLVLLQPSVDLWRLRELALSEGGLVNGTLRNRLCKSNNISGDVNAGTGSKEESRVHLLTDFGIPATLGGPLVSSLCLFLSCC